MSSAPLLGTLLDRWIAGEAGRSDAAFARVLNVDPSTISRARRGRPLDVGNLAAACIALEASGVECVQLYQEAGYALPPALVGDLSVEAA